MSEATVDSTLQTPPDATRRPLPWPPPGLERLQGDLWKASWKLLVGGVVLVLPLLWSLVAATPFYAVGPIEDAWWVLALAALMGLAVLVVGFTDTVRLLRRAAHATTRGYAWMTVALVASDAERDTGFLLQGGRAFSILSAASRATLVRLRLLTAGAFFAAAAYLPLGFTASVLLAARGSLASRGVLLLTLVPPVVALVVSVVAGAAARAMRRKARKAWYARGWAEDLERDEIADWRTRMAGAGSDAVGTGGAGAGRAFRLGAVLAGVAVALVALPSLTLVATSGLSPILAMVSVPRYAATQQRAAEAEALRDYRVATDPALSADVAGEILHVLTFVGATHMPEGVLLLPPARRYDEPWLPEGPQGPDNPTGIPVDRWPAELLPLAGDGLSPEAAAFLRTVAAHPAHEEFSTLARAAHLDVVTARMAFPLPDSVRAVEIPIPPFSALREGARAHIGLAATHLAAGRPREAERVVREVVSVGFLLGDEGATLIDNLIGFALVRMGGQALESLYDVTGGTTESEMLRRAVESTRRATERASVRGPSNPLNALQEMPELVTDSTVLRGLRWESFLLLNSLAPCLNVRRIVFGPDASYEAWLDEARGALVRSPAEGELFELFRQGFLGRRGEAADRSWLGSVLGLTLGDADSPGTCGRLMQDLVGSSLL